MRAVVIATVVLVSVAAFPATAGAKPAPKPPAWVLQALDSTPRVLSAEGVEDVDVRAAGQSIDLSNAFTFDRNARYFSSDITTGANLEEVLTVYASGDNAWVDVADPAFRGHLPAGKRFVTVPVQDLTESGLASTDANVWFAPVYALLGVTHAKLKPKQGAGKHVYIFDVDLAAAKKAAPDAVRPAFLKAYGQLPPGKGTRAHGTVTVDDQHVVREFEVRFDVRTAAQSARLTVYLSLDTVGESVDAVVPPDAQAVAIDSVPGLRQQLSKSLGAPVGSSTAGSS